MRKITFNKMGNGNLGIPGLNRLVLLFLVISSTWSAVYAQSDSTDQKVGLENDKELVYLHDLSLNTAGNAYLFPQRFKISSVSVKQWDSTSEKHYLLDINDHMIILLNRHIFREGIPDSIMVTAIYEIPVDNIQYVKTMTRYSFSKVPLEKNDYYRKFTRKKFWSGFLTTTGATAVSGLLIDVFFTGIGLGTFPAITAAFSIVGIPFGIMVAGSNYLLDNTGKTGVFFSKHLLEMEKISFKYHFKYGSRAFNLKALDYVRFESIEEKRNLK